MQRVSPILDRDISKFVIVTDETVKNEKAEVLEYLCSLARVYNLRCGDIFTVPDADIKQGKQECSQWDREIFDKYWGVLKEPVCIETLLKYCEGSNEQLYHILRENKIPLKELLWQEYQRRFSQEDSMHLSYEHYGIAERIAEEIPDAHIFTILFNHRVTSPAVGLSDGNFDYHFVGRGFYAFGHTTFMEGKSGRFNVSFPISLVNSQSLEQKKVFIREMFNHEWVGHIFYGLKDHFDISPEECVMVPKPSISLLLKIANSRKEIYFCKDCQAHLE